VLNSLLRLLWDQMDINKLKFVIEGRVFNDEETLQEVQTDFGNLQACLPTAVVVPASPRDVHRAVEIAFQEGWSVSVRGAAHSQGGQSLSEKGILIDMSALNRIETISRDSIWVQAGATWSDLVQETLERGLVPPVLTNSLSSTVGGTISIGGIGAASHRHGLQADNVCELEVITGDGHLVNCSPQENAELFDCTRSGLGQFSVITRARLKLRRCKEQTRTYFLLYDDVSQLMRDLEMLTADQRFDFIEAWAVPCSQGFRRLGQASMEFAEWFFPVQLTVEYSKKFPTDELYLANLRFYRQVEVEDRALLEFLYRQEPLFSRWKENGAWRLPHPWMDALLPWSVAAPYLLGVLRSFPPELLVNGQMVLWPCRLGNSSASLFQRPRGDLAMGYGIHTSVPRSRLPMALPMLAKASDLCLEVGGKRYLSGWVDFDHEEWKRHFDAVWPALLRLKKFHDPKGLLNPGFIQYTDSGPTE
jgi:cytokinin dehydrogenase